jgi:hypothetical protein
VGVGRGAGRNSLSKLSVPLRSNQSNQPFSFGFSSVFGAGPVTSGGLASSSGSAGVVVSIVPPPGNGVEVLTPSGSDRSTVPSALRETVTSVS